MRSRHWALAGIAALLAPPSPGRSASAPRAVRAREPLTVFAASDLARPFEEIASMFERAQGIPVRLVFGASGNLALQLEHGAPADLFFAANIAFVDGLCTKGITNAGTQHVYARGRLVLATTTTRTGLAITSLRDLSSADVKRVAIANPETAPYGKAAREALEALRLWDAVRPKLVYGENIRHTLQLVQSGAVDAGVLSATASREPGLRTMAVDEKLHAPIDQAAAVVAASRRQRDARAFLNFVLGPEGRAVMARYGFTSPESP